MKTKILCLLLLSMFCVMFTVSCKKYTQKVDKNKTQLYVAIQDGGYGKGWLEDSARRFEEKYKTYSFEEGKTGVQVIIDCNSKYKGSNLTNILNSPDLEYEVFFTEGVNYYDLITRELILDITDVVTNDLTYNFLGGESQTEYTSEGSIEDKIIADDLTNYLNDNGKYYAVPYFDAYYGIIYDVDLFNEYNFWFAADGQGDKLGFVKNENTPKSAGPDGVSGTYDDGLPATYDDFFKLLDHMVEVGVVPFTWGGKVQEYLSYFMQQLCVNYEGLANSKTDYYFEGTISTYVSGFDATTGLPIEESRTITKAESYLLNNKRAGKYYAFDFMERLLHNTSYYDLLNCTSPSVTHIDAKKNFLYPRYIKTANTSEIAMIIDGTWWQNEAAGAFEQLVNLYGSQASAQERKFGIMPLPKANASKIGEPFVISNGGSSYGFIKAAIKESKTALAKCFLQFLQTNEELCYFTKNTSATRPYNYTFAQDDFDSLTYFGQQAYNVHTTADYLIPYSKDADFIRNSAKVGYMWQTKVNGSQYGLPSYALINNPNMTARQLFDGLSNMYTESYWTTNLGPFNN